MYIINWIETVRPQSRSITGYGKKLPSSKMVLLNDRPLYRRVYVMLYSNIGTEYIVIKGKMILLDGIEDKS